MLNSLACRTTLAFASTVIVALSLLVLATAIVVMQAGTQPQPDTASPFPWSALLFLVLISATAALAGGAIALFQRQPAEPPTALSRDDFTRAREALEAEVSHLAGLMASGIDSHDSYAETLQRVQTRLAVVETPEQLRALASVLAAENQAMRRDTRNLSMQLDASRKQIEALRTSLQQERQVGLRDGLTEIGNRRSFNLSLDEAIKAAISMETPLALILLDIDGFKAINDTHGHGVGDEVLKSCAKAIAEGARKEDHVARIGGEEFAIVMPDASDLVAAISAERLRGRLESDAVDVGADAPLRYTASFGVSQLQRGDTAEALVQRADARLYRAKNQGRNRVVTS